VLHIRSRLALKRPELARAPGLGGWRWACASACEAEARRLEAAICPAQARSFGASFMEFFRTVDLLSESSEELWPTGFKGRWLKAVYENLRATMQKEKLFSDGDILREFCACDPLSLELPLLEPFNGVELCGFSQLFPMQLNALLHISHIRPLVFSFNYDPAQDAGKSHTALDLIRTIERAGRDLNVEIEYSSHYENSMTSALLDFCRRVTLIECESREQETDWCSQQVRNLLASGGAPNSIALITSEVEAYRPYLRRQIREHAMPYAYRRSTGILSAPALRFLTQLPAMLDRHVRIEALTAFADAASCGALSSLWPFDRSDSLRCIEFLRRAGIFELEGRRWLSDFPQGDERKLLEKLADAMDALRSRFGNLCSLAGHIDSFIGVLDGVRFCLPENIDDRRHFSLDWHAVQIAVKVLEEWRASPGVSEVMLAGSDFLDEMILELERSIRLRSSPEPDVVAVLSPEEAVGNELKHIFWLGLSEGAYPPSSRSGILSDAEARRINRRAQARVWPESGSVWRAARELFFNLLQNTGEVTLSYFRHTEDGEEKQASPLYIEVRELKQAADPGCSVKRINSADIAASQKSLLAAAARNDDITVLSTMCGEEKIERVSRKMHIERERRNYFSRRPDDSANETPAYCGAVPDFRLDDPPRCSPAFFESYVRCPFRHFVDRVLCVEELPEEFYELDARNIGTVLHETLKRTCVVNGGAWDRPPDELEVLQLARQLEMDFRRLAPSHDDSRVALALLRSQEWAERLNLYMQRAAASSDGRTIMTEAPFGDGSNSQAALVGELELCGPAGTRFCISGRIDRVDWDGQVLFAVDYKTGGAKNYSSMLKAETWGIENFQMPIYLLALQRSVESGKIGIVPRAYAARVVALKEPEKKDHETNPPLLPDDQLFCGDEFTGMLENIILRAGAGNFGIDPVDCKGCSYPALCRIVKQIGKDE